ncbi:MAG: aldo/keto reductase [Pseudomonadales bacterium]
MSELKQPNRREFLRWTALTGAATGLATHAANTPPNKGPNEIRSYRRLGRTNLQISDISFGSAALRHGQEDVVHHALDRGINYFDSAYSYTRGAAEKVLGKVFEGMRDKVVLVSKVEGKADWSKEQMMYHLDQSLTRLKTDYIDVYMAHAVNDINRLKSPEWHEFAELAKKQGKIRFIGMSGHAGYLVNCLDYALDQDMVDVILVAYNFNQDPDFLSKLTRSVNWIAKQPELPRVLKKAKELDVGTVVMKTLHGARLNDMRPYETQGTTFSQAAFRWVLSNTDVDALVVTMRDRERIDEYLGASGSHQLAFGDLELLQRYAKLNGSSYCRHACNDCSGACPFGVDIADVLRTRMYATDYQDVELARDEYAKIGTNASACLNCSGEPCRSACTHGIRIDEFCGPTHRMLA